jgi:hypothetical protein
MKYTQDYRYQNISGVGRNCDDRWNIISKYVNGDGNTLSIDVGSAEGVFSKRIVEKTGGKVISIEGSDFVYNEQLNYCANEINSHNIQLHKTALNRDTLHQFLGNHYDYTLLMSVLHWCDEPDIILRSLSDISEYIFVELPDLNDTKSYGQEYLQRIKRDFGNIQNYLQETTNKPIVGAYKVEGNNSEYRVVYVLKNIPNVELVDVDDVYHLIHGSEEKIEYSYLAGTFKAVPIGNSPVVAYINGDVNAYRNQPKLFYKREDTIKYLLDEYENGDIEWLFKAVLYKGKYVISDGMHRSSVLYTNGYRKVFVEIVSGASEKTATFERFLTDDNFVNPNVDNIVDNPINDGHYIELLDRTHVACCMVSDHLVEHPLSIADKEIREVLEEALNKLYEAYQIIGNKTP